MQPLDAGGTGTLEVLFYVVDEEGLGRVQMLLAEYDLESLFGGLPHVHEVGEVGGVETTREDVKSVFCLQPSGETVIVDLVGVAEQEHFVSLSQPLEQLHTLAGNVDKNGVDNVVDVVVAQMAPCGAPNVVAVLGRREEPFLKQVHLVCLEILRVIVRQVVNAVAGKSLADILVAYVMNDAPEIKYDVFYHCGNVYRVEIYSIVLSVLKNAFAKLRFLYKMTASTLVSKR